MKKISLLKQLWMLTMFLVGIIAMLGGFTFWRSAVLYSTLDEVANSDMPALHHSMNADMLHDGLRAVVMESLYKAEKKDAKALGDLVKEKDEMVANFHSHIDSLLKLKLDEHILTSVRNSQAALKEYTTVSSDLVELAKNGKFSEAEALLPRFQERFELLEEKLEVLGNAIAEDAAKISSASSNTLFTIGTLSFFGIVLGLLLSIWSMKNLKFFVRNFLAEIMNASVGISEVSEKLNTANNQFSSSATEAAASLQETVASLDELSSMVTLNTESAQKASGVSIQSRASAEKGEKQIIDLSNAMNEIKTSSKKMEEIINVIDEIAFQTNLLALNAAVEAARAGEQGRGFAVVAEAVRALAQRSASAAKDISSLIKESIQKIDFGGEIVESSREALNQIFVGVKEVSDLNQQIASASTEQSTGIKQISQAMNQLDEASQQNAKGAQEVSFITTKMFEESTRLKTMVAEMNSRFMGSAPLSEAKAATDTTPALVDGKSEDAKNEFSVGNSKKEEASKNGVVINLEEAAQKKPLFKPDSRKISNLNDF